MPVSAAYIAVVLIWSTTPLGILWSSETVNPTMAVLLRMIIAVIPGWLILKLRNTTFPWHKQAMKVYLYSAVGIFGGMLFSYFAAAYISSGLMSLVFGLSPILSGVLSKYILNDTSFSGAKRLALLIAVAGLAIVCHDKITFENDAYIGLLFIFCAVSFFSLSGVMIKSVEIVIDPMATTVGALLVSIPMFTLAWLIFDGTMPIETWGARSLWTILYLGIVGSLIGFLAYFYVLQKLPASTVALITMITPVIAIALGALLNDEAISESLVIGAGFIILGLGIYQWGGALKGKVINATN